VCNGRAEQLCSLGWIECDLPLFKFSDVKLMIYGLPFLTMPCYYLWLLCQTGTAKSDQAPSLTLTLTAPSSHRFFCLYYTAKPVKFHSLPRLTLTTRNRGAGEDQKDEMTKAKANTTRSQDAESNRGGIWHVRECLEGQRRPVQSQVSSIELPLQYIPPGSG
jgi:hypothetical protein